MTLGKPHVTVPSTIFIQQQISRTDPLMQYVVNLGFSWRHHKIFYVNFVLNVLNIKQLSVEKLVHMQRTGIVKHILWAG